MTINSKKQDILLTAICILLFANRAIPIDCSSLWQIAILLLSYITIRLLCKQIFYFIFNIIGFAGLLESIIAILQNHHYIDSNHHAFPVTGTFGNPGPLGGFLAVCLVIVFWLFYKSIQNKNSYLLMGYTVTALCICYGLLLTESRAGWLAASIGLIFLIHAKIRHYFPIFQSPIHYKAIIISAVCIFICILYFWKRDSADGRLFIWLNTLNMIIDHPLLGTGTGGWLANYMYYQADYFTHHPESAYITLTDNVFYPYNEALHFIAEQGIAGLFCLLLFFHSLFREKYTNDAGHLLKGALLAFIVFACFSYPADVFILQLLFVCLIAMMQSRPTKTFFPRKTAYISYFIILICLMSTSIWSYRIYYRTSTEINKLVREDKGAIFSYRLLDNSALFFCHNSRLMYGYSQICFKIYAIDKALQILQSTSQIVPTCELYCDIGDLWKLKKDFIQAEKNYRVAASMIPNRLTPNYKLFQLYIEQGNKKAALQTGKVLLKQPAKREGTKTLRMKAEVSEYLLKNQDSKIIE